MKLFVVFDSASESYGPPTSHPATGAGIRWFSDLANDPKTIIAQHPDQFTLFETGSYDQQTGLISQFPTHKSLGTALEYKSKAN